MVESAPGIRPSLTRSDQNVFMVALPRSGSTLLAYVLDSHSQIYVVHEDSGRPDRTARDKEMANLRTKVKAGFAGYLDDLLAPAGKPYLVTSRYYARPHVEFIQSALGPQVKFVVLTRRHMWRVFQDADGNPRVVPFRQMLEFAACRRWLAAHACHVTVAYEDVVTAPTRVFSRLCQFIGVTFEPAMLDYHNFEHPLLDHRGNEKARRLPGITPMPTASGFPAGLVAASLAFRAGWWRAGGKAGG
jgi:hypothetical protein